MVRPPPPPPGGGGAVLACVSKLPISAAEPWAELVVRTCCAAVSVEAPVAVGIRETELYRLRSSSRKPARAACRLTASLFSL